MASVEGSIPNCHSGESGTKIARSDFEQPQAGPQGAEYRDVFRNPGLEWYRALGARSQNLIAAPAPRAGFFFLLVQRKETKRKHAPDGALILASAALGPALTRRDNPCRASQPQASCLRPFGRSPKALRGSGAPCGDINSKPIIVTKRLVEFEYKKVNLVPTFCLHGSYSPSFSVPSRYIGMRLQSRPRYNNQALRRQTNLKKSTNSMIRGRRR